MPLAVETYIDLMDMCRHSKYFPLVYPLQDATPVPISPPPDAFSGFVPTSAALKQVRCAHDACLLARALVMRIIFHLRIGMSQWDYTK